VASGATSPRSRCRTAIRRALDAAGQRSSASQAARARCGRRPLVAPASRSPRSSRCAQGRRCMSRSSAPPARGGGALEGRPAATWSSSVADSSPFRRWASAKTGTNAIPPGRHGRQQCESRVGRHPPIGRVRSGGDAPRSEHGAAQDEGDQRAAQHRTEGQSRTADDSTEGEHQEEEEDQSRRRARKPSRGARPSLLTSGEKVCTKPGHQR
jgi:hypothetical protein